MQDISAMNPKGHVKLELYNDNGVFFTKEKKNLVVQSANKIVAEMMADPAKVLRVSQVDKGNTALAANSEGFYAFDLSVKHEAKSKLDNDWGSNNVKTDFELEELKNLSTLEEVKVGNNVLVIDKDVMVKDAVRGKISFAVAPVEAVSIKFHKITNAYMKIVAGTEQVTVEKVAWTRSDAPSDADKHYKVDTRTGEILFESAHTEVEVAYDYNMNYALGFMALGGRPNPLHPNYQPVEFGNSNKLDPDMKNEFAGSRSPIHFPASISTGATEIEPAIPTQPVAVVLKNKDVTITHNGNGVTKLLVYPIPNIHDNGYGNVGRTLHQIVSIRNNTQSKDIPKENVILATNSLSKVELQFKDEDVAMNDVVHVEYKLKLDDRHLTYQMGQSPVVELVSVRHTDAVTLEKKEYAIVDSGLRPNQGDVWISNPNTGHIQFSSAPTSGAPKVETPGQLQVEYLVNSGTVVKFVADFPKGVPAPSIENAVKNQKIVSGQNSVLLNYPIAKDALGAFMVPVIKVTRNSVVSTLSAGQYSISGDGRTVNINSLDVDDEITIEHKYEKTTHDIYQVAMFDDKVSGRMFNISGIGPVTKDQNTGMRVTWSVTF